MWRTSLGNKHLWQEQARAVGGEELVATIEGLASAQETMTATQTTMAEDIHEIKESLAGLVKTAFPGSDAEGHRRYHEAVISRTAAIEHLTWAIKEKTIFGLLWMGILLIGASVWFFFLSKLTKGTP